MDNEDNEDRKENQNAMLQGQMQNDLDLDLSDGENITCPRSRSTIYDEKSETVEQLITLIAERDEEITQLKKKLSQMNRQLEKTGSYNEDLRQQILKLSSQIHQYQNVSVCSVETQVDETCIIETMGDKPMPKWVKASSQEHELSISESLKAVVEDELLKQQEKEEDIYQQLESKAGISEASSEYVFDTSSGFYYHPGTGYYWDPNSGLFYDYTTATYFQYNEDTEEYEVHSKVDVDGAEIDKHDMDITSISHELDSISSTLSEMKIDPQKCRQIVLEMTENFPPCVRMIVQESDQLDLGLLYIVTCAGGTIGREKGKNHVIEVNDSSVSKEHAQIEYDYEKSSYILTDNGSQNGTVLNGKRLSKSKSESCAHLLQHNDVLQVGSTKFLLHIHKGSETCDDCEPGQVQAKLKARDPIKNSYTFHSKEEKSRQRRKELKNIKKKYGLQNSYFENAGAVITNPDFCDKAHLRRKFIGSETEIFKPAEAPASVERPISSSNKGHKLLSKMGWKEGEGLGKTKMGIAEPINVEMRVNQSAGLGSAGGASLSLDKMQDAGKAKRWSQAQQRFQQLVSSEEDKNQMVDSCWTTATAGTKFKRKQSANSTKCITDESSFSLDTSDFLSLPSNSRDSPSINDSYNFPSNVPLMSSSGNKQGPKQLHHSKPSILKWVKGNTEQLGQLIPETSQNEQMNQIISEGKNCT